MVWHDCAVFHFITDPEYRIHYVELLKRSLPIGGHFVVGTFAKGGPEKCSGLTICQYDAATMRTELGPSFEPVKCSEYLHTTPTGQPQQFFFGTLRGNFAGALRQGWSLLQRDAIKHYSIADTDDVSALIIHWARALVLGEEFYPMVHCKRYDEHWAALGTTSMEAAGWKKG